MLGWTGLIGLTVGLLFIGLGLIFLSRLGTTQYYLERQPGMKMKLFLLPRWSMHEKAALAGVSYGMAIYIAGAASLSILAFLAALVTGNFVDVTPFLYAMTGIALYTAIHVTRNYPSHFGGSTA